MGSRAETKKKEQGERQCIVNEKHRVYLPPSVSVTALQAERAQPLSVAFFSSRLFLSKSHTPLISHVFCSVTKVQEPEVNS